MHPPDLYDPPATAAGLRLARLADGVADGACHALSMVTGGRRVHSAQTSGTDVTTPGCVRDGRYNSPQQPKMRLIVKTGGMGHIGTLSP